MGREYFNKPEFQSEYEPLYGGENDLPIAELKIEIPKIKPDIEEKNKTTLGNLNTKEGIRAIRKHIAKTPSFKRLLREIAEGKKSAVLKPVLGGLVIVVAAGSAFEFGVRGGRDVKTLINRWKIGKK